MNQEINLVSGFHLAVIGGGASGYMAAITASESGVDNICILEGTAKTLEKVRISGGGRCNVTNSVWENKDLINNYPRGKRELLGPFSYFSTLQAFNWFEERGLKLSIEKDGRVFPSSNSSRDVINCLHSTAIDSGVNVFTKKNVYSIDILRNKQYFIKIKDGSSIIVRNVILATGGSPSGRSIAAKLGHKVVHPVPSLFTFGISDSLIKSCKGVTISDVEIKLETSRHNFCERGNILITHWGFSGPVILKLSAFAARSLNEDSYKAKIRVNWIGNSLEEAIFNINLHRKSYSKKLLINSRPYLKIPKRLWLIFLQQISIPSVLTWSNISKFQIRQIAQLLINSEYNITRRGPYGEEFVTAGGVSLEEVYLKTMESRKLKGLYFVGEILNIDGITGGFNFQHCWTSGVIAGKAIASNN